MKPFISALGWCLACLMLLAGCKEAEQPGPSLTINRTNLNSTTRGYVQAGSSAPFSVVTINYEAKAPGGIQDVAVYAIGEALVGQVRQLDFIKERFHPRTVIDFSDEIIYTVPATRPNGSFAIRVEVTDKRGRRAHRDFEVNVTELRRATLSALSPATPANEVPAAIIAGSYFMGNVLWVNNAQQANQDVANADFAFDIVNGQPRLLGPDEASALQGTRADTRFARSSLDYPFINVSDVVNLPAPTEQAITITDAPGQNVFAFANPTTGRRGFVQVNSYTPIAGAANRGYIEFAVKVLP